MISPILVPLDGSQLAETAIPHAITQAKRTGAPLLLVRSEAFPPFMLVPVEGVVAPMSAEEYQQEFDAIRQEAETYLTAKAAELQTEGLEVTTHTEMGHPIDVILKAARENGASMIVMTTHGRSGLKRWYFGSVAEDVLRHSPVPVLLIRAPEPTGAQSTPPAGATTVL